MESSFLDRKYKITDATPAITTNIIKKSYNVAISIPRNCFTSPPSGKSLLNIPAISFDIALLINQTPINKEPSLTGESLATIDNPIGDKQSSPNV